MSRKTGKDVRIDVEVGFTSYPLEALSTVASPASEVGKKFETQAEFISGREDIEPDVRLDGVINGLSLAPGSSYNEVDYSAGSVYIKGVEIDVTAGSVSDLLRPTTVGQIRITALTVDENGDVNKTVGLPGAANTTRGAAGGPPFLPVDEVLIGYITMTYYEGSASGARVVTTSEINSEQKEYAAIPSYEILYHDGSGADKTDVGCVRFAAVLPLIHAATATGPGTNRRNVYAAYSAATFEQLPDAKDFSFDEDITTYKSKAYLDSAEETAIGTPSWSGTGTCYWDKVNDILSLVRNSMRWIRYYPDKDRTENWAGRCVFKVSRSLPLDDTMNASITLDGSGEIYPKS